MTEQELADGIADCVADALAQQDGQQDGGREVVAWQYRYKSGKWLNLDGLRDYDQEKLKRLIAEGEAYELRSLYASPPPAAVDPRIAAWVRDPDTIPKPIINACREAIMREFGDNGTDGYYKRILAAVFKKLQSALSARGEK